MNEGGVTTILAYGDGNHPHAVTSRTAVNPPPPAGWQTQPDGYTYDRDGNIAARTGGEKYTFDAENRLSSVASYPTQTSYWYDGLGNMDCRWTTTSSGLPNAVNVQDRYVDGLYEEHSVFGQSQYTIKNYYAFGRIIAQRKTTSAGSSSVTYLLADHLGSTVGTVSDAGVTEHMQYYPFGGVRSGHVSTDRGFTGQRREGGSRLGAYFYNARFYATGLGHFMSADTVSTDGLDRYAYAGFNPMRYSDPTGHTWTSDGGGSCDTACQWQAAWDAFHPNDASGGGGGGGDEECDAACGLRALAASGQGIEFWRDFAGGQSADPNVYGPDDLVADLGGITDLRTVVSPDAGVDARLLSLALLALPGPNPSGGVIKGFTREGIDRFMARDGVGISERAMLDAVKRPSRVITKVDEAGQVSYKYVGRDAVIVLNEAGEMVTGWARRAAGFRIPRP